MRHNQGRRILGWTDLCPDSTDEVPTLTLTLTRCNRHMRQAGERL